MFKNLFFGKQDKNRTGIYKVDSNTLIELDGIPGNGSINSTIEYLGFQLNHIHTRIMFDSKKIDVIGFKTLSKDIVFVIAKSKETVIKLADVSLEVAKIDWGFEYSSLRVEDILNEGIELQNLNLAFLQSVIDLVPDGDNLYKSNRLGLYFQFDNDLLVAFTSSSWANSSTKWLEDLNKLMVKRMKDEAALFHNNEIDIMEEVNKQTEAILGIPDAINNKFVSLHTKRNGNVNFYNLLITHYTQNCDLSDFLLVNKGRYIQVDSALYEVGKFTYHFDKNDKLDSIFDQ